MMEGQRLILSDGTVIENGQAGLASGFLWLWLPGWTMIDAVQKAFNPSAIQTIVYQYGEMKDTFEGYTVCTNIMQQDDEIAICLVKG